METLTGLLKKGQEILVQAGIEEAGLDARLLLEYITGKSRAYYLAHGEECVTKETAAGIWSWSQVARSISLFSI